MVFETRICESLADYITNSVLPYEAANNSAESGRNFEMKLIWIPDEVV